MAQSLLLSGLVKKYQSISSEIEHQEIKLAELKSQVRIIGDAIKVIDPDYNIRTIAKKRYYTKSLTAKGEETQRMLLEALRDAEKPLSLGELMIRIQSKMEVKPDTRARTKLRARLRDCIGRNLAKGLLEHSDRGYCIAGSEISTSQFAVHIKY